MDVQTQKRRTFRRCCTPPKMTQNHKAQVQFNEIRPNLNYKDGERHLAIAGAMGPEDYLGQKRTKPPFSLQNLNLPKSPFSPSYTSIKTHSNPIKIPLNQKPTTTPTSISNFLH